MKANNKKSVIIDESDTGMTTRYRSAVGVPVTIFKAMFAGVFESSEMFIRQQALLPNVFPTIITCKAYFNCIYLKAKKQFKNTVNKEKKKTMNSRGFPSAMLSLV